MNVGGAAKLAAGVVFTLASSMATDGCHRPPPPVVNPIARPLAVTLSIEQDERPLASRTALVHIGDTMTVVAPAVDDREPFGVAARVEHFAAFSGALTVRLELFDGRTLIAAPVLSARPDRAETVETEIDDRLTRVSIVISLMTDP